MNNFYELFEILNSASTREIIMAYENKITKYNNLDKLNDMQVYEIKMLKIGLHILTNPELRTKYNKVMGINSTRELVKVNKEPTAVNEPNDLNLDSLFNVDNSWMKNHKENSDTSKKSRFETNIGDRIFSLSELNKRPNYSSEFEASLRKPQQGREDKSTELLNKNKM